MIRRHFLARLASFFATVPVVGPLFKAKEPVTFRGVPLETVPTLGGQETCIATERWWWDGKHLWASLSLDGVEVVRHQIREVETTHFPDEEVMFFPFRALKHADDKPQIPLEWF